MTNPATARAAALIEALPYIQQFRGKTFVIKYGGSAMDDDHAVDRLLRDVVLLEAVGINPVLIHGGGRAISERMRSVGLAPRFVQGLRVTDALAVAIVEEVLDEVINPGIVRRIEAFGGRAAGILGKRILTCRKADPVLEDDEPVDLGFVGDLIAVSGEEIIDLVSSEVVPVISPLARDEDGNVYNINADIAAAAIAAKLQAAKMIYLSDVPGIMRDPGNPDSLIPSVNRASARALAEEGILTGGMIPKVESALDAISAGVTKVHFIDGRLPHALLLEVFTRSGVGTEIVA
jgi:acetylglutamate kinase